MSTCILIDKLLQYVLDMLCQKSALICVYPTLMRLYTQNFLINFDRYLLNLGMQIREGVYGVMDISRQLYFCLTYLVRLLDILRYVQKLKSPLLVL